MNREDQRIAIAKACGWERRIEKSEILEIERETWIKPGDCCDHGHRPSYYLDDLNAMHDAEKTILPKSDASDAWDEYVDRLGWCGSSVDCIHASASQRAEAFLRTLDLWIEETSSVE